MATGTGMNRRATLLALMMFLLLILYQCGCTYSITMIHTEGTASDVYDETASDEFTPTLMKK
jgi:hypothetical protein